MKISENAQSIVAEITKEGTKLGDLRKVAKDINKDHRLGLEVWSTGRFFPMMLAILIFDPKSLDAGSVDSLLQDIDKQKGEERLQLIDWLMANQLKDKKLTALLPAWQNSSSPLKRRIFWYHQGRLRWMGQTPPDNTAQLMDAIESKIEKEEPEVQWAMNLTAGWIGVFDTSYRNRCVAMGEKFGLYKDDFVHKNCTPSYLPEFIAIEAAKRNL